MGQLVVVWKRTACVSECHWGYAGPEPHAYPMACAETKVPGCSGTSAHCANSTADDGDLFTACSLPCSLPVHCLQDLIEIGLPAAVYRAKGLLVLAGIPQPVVRRPHSPPGAQRR